MLEAQFPGTPLLGSSVNRGNGSPLAHSRRKLFSHLPLRALLFAVINKVKERRYTAETSTERGGSAFWHTAARGRRLPGREGQDKGTVPPRRQKAIPWRSRKLRRVDIASEGTRTGIKSNDIENLRVVNFDGYRAQLY